MVDNSYYPKRQRANKTICSPTAGLCIVLTLLQVLLTGCIKVQKRPTEPLPIPATFSDRGNSKLKKKWWLDFADNSLNLLIQTALTDNFDLLVARNRIAEAEALVKQAGASLRPTVDGSGNITSSRNYQADKTSDVFFLGLAASYEVDLWGRLRSTESAQVAELQSSIADYDTASLTLSAEVAIGWFALVENRLQTELLQKQRETNSKVLELITAQFRSGKTGIADVLQQRQLVESNYSDLAELRAEGRLQQHRLFILLGLPPTSSLPPAGRLPELAPLPDSGVPLDLLKRRPDIESRYLRLQAADYRVAAAVADRFPRLSISAGLSTSGDRVDDLFSNWFSNLGANLFGPLIDGGRRMAEVERSRAIARQNFYHYGQTMLSALFEVEDGLIQEKELQVVFTSLQTQLRLAAETIDHVATRYRQGAEDYQRVLLALLSHQNLQRDILRTRKRLINNRVALYRAISGRLEFNSDGQGKQDGQQRADTRVSTFFPGRDINNGDNKQ